MMSPWSPSPFIGFEDVIPFWSVFFVGLAVIVFAIFVSIILKFIRRFITNFGGRMQEVQEERDQEGPFWYLAEIFHVLLYAVVFFAGYLVLNYLQSPSEDVSLYNEILGNLTLPTILLITFYFFFKSVPYIARRRGPEQEEGEEG